MAAQTTTTNYTMVSTGSRVGPAVPPGYTGPTATAPAGNPAAAELTPADMAAFVALGAENWVIAVETPTGGGKAQKLVLRIFWPTKVVGPTGVPTVLETMQEATLTNAAAAKVLFNFRRTMPDRENPGAPDKVLDRFKMNLETCETGIPELDVFSQMVAAIDGFTEFWFRNFQPVMPNGHKLPAAQYATKPMHTCLFGGSSTKDDGSSYAPTFSFNAWANSDTNAMCYVAADPASPGQTKMVAAGYDDAFRWGNTVQVTMRLAITIHPQHIGANYDLAGGVVRSFSQERQTTPGAYVGTLSSMYGTGMGAVTEGAPAQVTEGAPAAAAAAGAAFGQGYATADLASKPPQAFAATAAPAGFGTF